MTSPPGWHLHRCVLCAIPFACDLQRRGHDTTPQLCPSCTAAERSPNSDHRDRQQDDGAATS